MIEAKFEVKAFCTECKEEVDCSVYISGKVTFLIKACPCCIEKARREGYEKGYTDGEGREV
jgi:hypothetical protein